ncbi:MAG: PHP domain-containing protein [Clostridia bacterium]|nr:PHP domain-containing protein [Clostridia bacterium]
MLADLHVHTYYSDGLMPPCEVVLKAKQNGVGLLAVTDHDCALGYDEVKENCDRLGVKTVGGIEVSAYFGDVKIHTLGYNFDTNKPEFQQFYKKLYEGSLKRAEDIISKLNKNGVGICFDEVDKQRKIKNAPVHGMHIARALANKGYCNKNAFSVYSNYLAYGKCAYSCICRPSPEEAIEVINACGGFTSLAHPGRIDMGKDELYNFIKRLKGAGLGGIEAVYSTHTVSDTAYYKEIAKDFGLIVTGGSDTHYDSGSRRIGTPSFCPDEELAKALKI